MRKIIKIRTAATEQNINILHANWNIWWWFWYQTSEHYLLSEHKSNDINGYSSTKLTSHTLQTFVFKIFIWTIILKHQISISRYLFQKFWEDYYKKDLVFIKLFWSHSPIPTYLKLDPTNNYWCTYYRRHSCLLDRFSCQLLIKEM